MAEKLLMKGNEAIAEAALRAGCKCFFGYPITPQTEVAAYMAKKMPKIDGVYLQAESEIAAINMVLGASSAGVRAMTSSSSPGISLKSETISYMAGCDLPGVIVNVQRGGPGLGGIQPSQADYFQATRAPGHGDFHIIVLAPASVQEMADLVGLAFDLSDKYRIPAMILADGMLGQMMEPLEFSENTINLPAKDWATVGHDNKRKHNIINSLDLKPEGLEASVIRRFEKYETVKQNETRYDANGCDDAEIVVISYGGTSRIVNAATKMAREKGVKVGAFRPITLWPYPTNEIIAATANSKHVLVVEMSMGQMVEDVKLSLNGSKDISFFGHTGGIIPEPEEILQKIVAIKEGL